MARPKEVTLPEQVEIIIKRICREQSQPPVKDYARSCLAAIGENASIQILLEISSSTIKTSLSGFISYLVQKYHPNEASPVMAAYNFQSQNPRSPSASPGYLSPQNKSGDVYRSPSSNSPSSRERAVPRSTEDETKERTCPQKPIRELHLFGYFQSRSPSASPCYPSPQNRNGEIYQSSSSPERAIPRTTEGRRLFKDESKERTSPQKPNRELRFASETSETTSLLQILDNLEFRKLFLVLSYIGREKLEDVMTLDDAHDILRMKELSMTNFESKIWDSYGRHYYDKSDRSEYADWDCGKFHSYNCYVHQDGSVQLKGPYLLVPRNHMQRSLRDRNILSVKFSGDGMYGKDEEGIFIGSRQFQFFVYKDERKRKKKSTMEEGKKSSGCDLKCYFVELSGKKISEIRRLFMHIHTVSSIEKVMARLSLILSTTIKLQVDLNSVNIETIEDIPLSRDEHRSIVYDEEGKPILHTDGTGYISEDLAMQCPSDLWKAKYMKDGDFEKFHDFGDASCWQNGTNSGRMDPPLLMQVRLFYNGIAVKGTLLVNKKLEPGTIQVRPSMIKVEADPTLRVGQTFNSLEIVGKSHKPGRTFLSRYLIALLTYGGVPGDFFLSLLTNALEDAQQVYSNKIAALRVASNHEGLDDGFMAERMILSGIPLDEPFLQHCLSGLVNDEKKQFKTGKLPISESFYLMGTADPTGILTSDKVCVILESGQISGKVLVYRNPGLHFGDVHVLDAVYVEELHEYVGNSKYGIFFSTKGGRSAAYEMATGDFDGDMYWVSRNHELLKYFRASEPWLPYFDKKNPLEPTPNSGKIKPRDLMEEQLQHGCVKLYSEARKPNYAMATAADSWLSHMDQLLTLPDDSAFKKDDLLRKLVELPDIYYDALDAPKTGKEVKFPDRLKPKSYPHHMERDPSFSTTYHSTSILGQIYDRTEEFKTENRPIREISKLPIFDVRIPEEYLSMWRDRYAEYRIDMTKALSSGGESKNAAADEVIRKYKQLLYDAPEMDESPKRTEEIEMAALALYHAVYDHAKKWNDIGKCKFVWNVAGSALCKLHSQKTAGPNERRLDILSSLLRDILR